MHKSRSGNVNIITMGCSKNLVDSEVLMAKFATGGWNVEFDSSSEGHDLVIINTCGFVHDAKQESVDMILEYARAKTEGRIGKLCVIGCLSERYKNELIAEIPEADLVFGVNAINEITGQFDLEKIQCAQEDRILSTPSHYAYLKISEGCSRNCSFCIIPEIRGNHVSRPVEDLLLETKNLAEKGVKELILIAQDLTWYGKDLSGRSMLVELLRQLQTVKGIEWIRLHYAFPAGFPGGLLELINENNKICRYLDMPLQHISDNILKKMHRGITKEKTISLLNEIREKVPSLALRTTILVGHPGETELDFQELKDFVWNAKFDRLGVFPYSHEENTYAHKYYSDDIDDDEKNRRVSEIMQLQQDISALKNENKIGKTFIVIIDREDDRFFYARTEFDSPEVDNEVIIEKVSGLSPGRFCKVLITGSEEFDLYGRILD